MQLALLKSSSIKLTTTWQMGSKFDMSLYHESRTNGRNSFRSVQFHDSFWGFCAIQSSSRPTESQVIIPHIGSMGLAHERLIFMGEIRRSHGSVSYTKHINLRHFAHLSQAMTILELMLTKQVEIWISWFQKRSNGPGSWVVFKIVEATKFFATSNSSSISSHFTCH